VGHGVFPQRWHQANTSCARLAIDLLLSRAPQGVPVSVLTVNTLSVRYADHPAMRPSLDDICLSVDSHEIVGVSGPSGSGKTTLAMAIAGLLPAHATVSGTIALGRHDLFPLDGSDIQATDVRVVLQESASSLDPVRTIGAQLADVVRAQGGWDRRETRERVVAALQDVAFADEAARIFDAYPGELSGGQRQRILIAQAIVGGPSLVVADEPTASLDAASRDAILRLFRRLNTEHGTAFLILSHDGEALRRATHRTIAMSHGRVAPAMHGGHDAAGSDARVAISLSRSVSASRHAPLAEMLGAVKTYQHDRRTPESAASVHALCGVEIRIERGSVLGLTGPTGCGKSTLARCLAGLELLDAGRVIIDGHELSSPGGAARRVLNQIQLVTQDSAEGLDASAAALDVLIEPLAARRMGTTAEQRQGALDLLDQIGVHPSQSSARLATLSGGERQRVAIARALAARPKLLILDESLSRLDIDTRGLVTRLLLTRQREDEFAMLCISHDIELLASITMEIAVMRRGVIVDQGIVVRRYVPDRAMTA
jgi:peptide/nickel transport system ATP-binding protein